jgi:hypothetical protein
MWLLVRNVATINSSTAVGGTTDVTRGGRGIAGVFAGFEGKADKLSYNANIGWAQVAKARVTSTTKADSKDLGYEFNATVGYKLYDNLTASATAAYLVLGDAYGKNSGLLLPTGVADASNPYLTNIQLNYTF